MLIYQQLLQHVLDNGEDHDDRTGVGTKSVFGYQFRHDLGTGFPLLTTKKMFIRGIVEELIWFLNGKTDNQSLNEKNVHIWDAWATADQCAKFGRSEGDLGPIYGHQWRNFGGKVDQIKNLVDDLTNNSSSRRLIVTGWNPEEATKVALPPCHTLFQCKVSESFGVKMLDLQLYQRSADSFLGVPFNIASYALLTHLLAHVTGMIPRHFIHTFGDLHIYKNHIDQVQLQLAREPLPLPTIAIDRRLAGGGFEALLDFKYEDLYLCDYQSHEAIKAPVAI